MQNINSPRGEFVNFDSVPRNHLKFEGSKAILKKRIKIEGGQMFYIYSVDLTVPVKKMINFNVVKEYQYFEKTKNHRS